MTIVALVILIFKIVIALAIVLAIIVAGWKSLSAVRNLAGHLMDNPTFESWFADIFVVGLTVGLIVFAAWAIFRFNLISHA
jgi:hypothetical protein